MLESWTSQCTTGQTNQTNKRTCDAEASERGRTGQACVSPSQKKKSETVFLLSQCAAALPLVSWCLAATSTWRLAGRVDWSAARAVCEPRRTARPRQATAALLSAQ